MALDAASSSSSAQLIPPKKYDVFISFRGEDTRTNFTSHLYEAFGKSHIKAYIDYKVRKGEEIWPELKQAIEDSYVSVVVFSENYASSRWCLKELIHILDCKRDQGQLVIPVFYKVDPSHVRNQTGRYKQAFEKHERDPKVDQHEMQMWRHGLAKAANLAGWAWDPDSRTIRDESELIQKIVKDILQKLRHRYPPIELKGLVSVNDKCAQIELLLREGQSQTIGIWGMGGIGKTTIAKVMFVKYASHYEGCCFLKDVREKSEKLGLDDLRRELFSQLLDENDRVICTSSTFFEFRLRRMKVFIVLDDVSSLKQIEHLVGDHHCFGTGSKIIFTTRDKDVLKGVNEIYEVKELNFQESLELFSLNAFNQNLPIMGYEELSERAVGYAKGIPLALKVLGSFLFNKSEIEWNSGLERLKKSPHEDIQKALRLSYNGLHPTDQKIFLDIACFLRGKVEGDVISLLDGYDFDGHIGLRKLQDKALINVDNGVYVEMHDLIQQMGQEIVREESINEPEWRSRLWDPKEIYKVLANNKGTNKIEGILFDVSQIKDLRLSLSDDTFKRMPNLRFLKISAASYHRQSHVHLPKGLESFPDELSYLEWSGYPLKSLPSTFCVGKLVELHMPCSGVQKLWDGVQDLVSLKRINLSESRQLIELPDFSKALNLEYVNLDYCTSLKSLPSTFCFKKLVELHMPCSGVQKLWDGVQDLVSLKRIELWGSRQLIELPDFSKALNLEQVNLDYCTSLREVHSSILSLHSLASLSVTHCEKIKSLTELPNNTEHLSRLERLNIRNCKRLRSLPKLPPSIEELYAHDCVSLETVPRLLSRNSKRISFGNCVKLNEQSLHNISEDAYSGVLCLSEIWLPGSGVLEWFKYRTMQRTIIIELPLNSHLLGFAFCIAFFPSELPGWVEFHCVCYLGDFKVLPSWSDPGPWSLGPEFGPEFAMNSDHVCVMYNQSLSLQILKEIDRRRGEHQLVTNLKLSFEISAAPQMEGCIEEFIKEYGVHPIYKSEYEELVRQEELEWNEKRPRDVDEQQPLPPSKKPKPDFGIHTDALLNRC